MEIAVIGAGPAGAAAAIRLAEAGREVVLLERAREAGHKVCGEFLSAEVLAALDRLRLPAGTLGAVPIDRLRISAGGAAAEAPLPFPAAGLSRRRLDAALADRAAAAGAEVRRGVQVRGPTGDGPARLELADSEMVEAGTVLLATGKHDLRGRGRETGWRGRDGMLGIKMHLRLGEEAQARLGRRIELHLFRGGCAGLQAVEDASNLCVTLSTAAYARAGGCLDGLLAAIGAENAAFAEAVGGCRPLWPRPLAIARVPYGHLHRPGTEPAPAVWRVGDQAAVTPSFTGDGLAIALESGLLAAETLLAGAPRRRYEERLYARVRRQMRPAMRLQALVDRPALHRPGVAAARLAPALLAAAAGLTRLRP